MFIPNEPFTALFSEHFSEAAGLNVRAILIVPGVVYDATRSSDIITGLNSSDSTQPENQKSTALALMSSTPFSPWIHSSEPILRYRRITGGDVLGHSVTGQCVHRTPLAQREVRMRVPQGL